MLSDANQSANPLRRQWFRYGLRTLFVVLTISCVWLGFVVNRAHRQQRAVAIVKELGGEVVYDYQLNTWSTCTPELNSVAPPGPRLIRERLGIDYVANVAILEIPSSVTFETLPGPTDADLAKLRGLPNLHGLFISQGRITDGGCEHISTLTGLRELTLTGAPLTDKGLEPIGTIKSLEILRLDNCPISGGGLIHLAQLTSLEQLSLANTNVDDVGLEFIAKLPRLKSLDLTGTSVTDRGLAKLARMPLELLWLGDVRVTDEGVEQLARFRKLRHLYVNLSMIPPGSVRRLENSLPQIRVAYH